MGLGPEASTQTRPDDPEGGSGIVRANQSVGMLGAGLDSGGRRFRAGRKVRGPEVPG